MRCVPVVKKLDDLRRLVTPKEYLSHLGLAEQSFVEVYGFDDCILFRPHRERCAVCGCMNTEDSPLSVDGKRFCPACVKKIHYGMGEKEYGA